MFRLSTCVLLLLGVFAAVNAQLFGRIVRGNMVQSIDNQRHMVSVQQDGEHVCGGAILSNTRILTAGKCVNEVPVSSLTIRAGSLSHEYGGKIFKVSSAFLHPNYDEATADNDVAILVLESSITFNDAAWSIALAGENEDIQDGLVCSVAGWGSSEATKFSNLMLHVASVRKVDNAACEEQYAFNARMACLSSDTGSTCNTDTGSPLVCDGMLFGVAINTYTCGNSPGAYVKISNPTIYNYIKKFI